MDDKNKEKFFSFKTSLFTANCDQCHLGNAVRDSSLDASLFNPLIVQKHGTGIVFSRLQKSQFTNIGLLRKELSATASQHRAKLNVVLIYEIFFHQGLS